MIKKPLKRKPAICFLFIFIIVSLVGISEEGIANQDASNACINCEQIVSGFCTALRQNDFQTAHQSLSKSGLGKTDEADFIKEFRKYQSQGGQLHNFSLLEIKKQKDEVLVKVAMQFQKEIPPRIVSGVHSFRLVNENGAMKIHFIIPPTSPPPIALIKKSGGSHPGVD